MSHTIDLFMWGYQSHFRIHLEIGAKDIFKRLGTDVEPVVTLVGLRRAGTGPGHPVCVEPEKNGIPVVTFAQLGEAVERAIPQHPLQKVFYGDQASMAGKPVRIRQMTIADEVERHLAAEDRRHGLKSFCSEAAPVDDYDVVVVVQIPADLLTQFPPIPLVWQREPYETNLVISCIRRLLDEAVHELGSRDPGRSVTADRIRSAPEIIRLAASTLMRSPFLPGRFGTSDLFDDINLLSQTLYEGNVGKGRIMFAKDDDPNIEDLLRFAEPVRLSATRWARKLLQMAGDDAALLAEYGDVFGLGRVSDLSSPPYTINFTGHHQWELRRGGQVLMRCHFGEARLPAEPLGRARLADNLRRVFFNVDDSGVDRFLQILDSLTELPKGSSLIIAEDAAAEATRLAGQGTAVAPTKLTKEILGRAAAIDGTILVDTSGVCHAIGVILDGAAVDACLPSRGARYNSALRYVTGAPVPRMAFVISDDRTLDVMPLLRKRVDRTLVAQAVAAIEQATLEDYHAPRRFLDEHRFYLSGKQCAAANEALDRIESEPREMGRIVIITKRFEPDPAMLDAYFEPERAGRR